MVQSPSWEANRFAASQEIPHISRNPKVHYRTHKRPPPVPILGQPNLVHIPTSHLLEIHPNIIHPSTPRSPQWSPSLRFPHQDPIYPLSSPIRATCPAPSHSSRFYHPHNIGEEYRSFSSSLCNLLHTPVTTSLLGSNILLNAMFSNSSYKIGHLILAAFNANTMLMSLRFITVYVCMYVSFPYKRHCETQTAQFTGR